MPRKRVLFVCIGNSCRSQMAEGFARAYGADVMEPCSAGLYPASFVASLTHRVMREKNIDMNGQFPKALEDVGAGAIDIVVNMSGQKVPVPPGAVLEEWNIQDPIGLSEDVYRTVVNEIEQRVMRLVLSLRASMGGVAPQSKGPAQAEVPRVRRPPRRKR